MPENSLDFKVNIAIIGGSGVYDSGIFKKEREIDVQTQYGSPSSSIEIGDFLGQKVAFLARHGKNHQFPPHKVPQRANISALKELGVERIIGVCAVGSLEEDYQPGDIVICDQFIDFTKKRDYTFYDAEAVHLSSADPFCLELRELFLEEAKNLNLPVHEKGTYLCIEGPRFSTKAESKFFKDYADIIGMTLVPEATLAREMEMCYLSLAAITDWDVWKEGKEVSAEEIINTMKGNLEKIQQILKAAIPNIKEERNCPCKTLLKGAKF